MREMSHKSVCQLREFGPLYRQVRQFVFFQKRVGCKASFDLAIALDGKERCKHKFVKVALL